MSIHFMPASEIPFEDFLDAFNTAYSDYYVPIYMEHAPMLRLIERDGIDLSASWVAKEGGRVVGVGMLAQRGARGWIGGLGVVPSHRGQGIGRGIMDALIQSGHTRNLTEIWLEVISVNHPARRLYDQLGFASIRELAILECPLQNIDRSKAPNTSIEIKAVNAEAALLHYHKFHTLPNPWQRSYEGLAQLADSMDAWLARRDGVPVAYAVGWLLPYTTRFMDMALLPGQEEALATLLDTIHQQSEGESASIINVGKNDPVYAILVAAGYQETNSQIEMALTL